MSKAVMQQALEVLRGLSFTASKITSAKEALAAALADPEQPVAINWTLNGDKHCGYDNWLGETPFGRVLITWKSWKEFPNACVDEFPGGFDAYGDPEDVKAECEAEFRRRIGAAPTPRKPDDDEVEQLRAQNTELDAACARLEALNAELVEALRYLRDVLPDERWADDSRRMADAALAKAQGESK